MNMPIKHPLFVEVLARNGEVIARHRIAQLPARIGRGYDNDVILDDPYVAANHVLLEASAAADSVASDATAALSVRDLGSRNGLFRASRGAGIRDRRGAQRQSSISLAPDTVFRIGHSLLRVRVAGQPVASELQDTTSHSWEGATPTVLALAGVLLVGLFQRWESATEGGEPLQYVLVLLGLLGLTLLWASGWALVNRIFDGRVRFGRHLFIIACALILSFAWSELSELAAFAFSLEFLTRFATLVLTCIVGGAIYFHLRTVKPQAQRAAALAAVGLVLISGTFELVTKEVNNRRLSDQLYMSDLKPPVLRISSNLPAAKFFERAKAMKEAVDRERKELPGEGGED